MAWGNRWTESQARQAGIINTKPKSISLKPKTIEDYDRKEISKMLLKMSPPQQKLTIAALAKFGDIVYPELRPFSDRRFQIDLAFPCCKLAVEVDGWENHGKSLDAFKSDRERYRLLGVNGWTIFPFPAGDINKDTHACIEEIEQALEELPKWKSI